MKVDRDKRHVETFRNTRDGGEELTLRYTNWGEPYDEGVALTLKDESGMVHVSLVDREARRLRDALNKILG